MREISLLLLVLAVIQAHAEGDKPAKKARLNLTPPGQETSETEDPGSATRLLYADPRNPNSPAALSGDAKPTANVKPTCTDNMGMVYKKGDSGYDGCLRTFGAGTPPQLPGDNRKRSVGISIGQ